MSYASGLFGCFGDISLCVTVWFTCGYGVGKLNGLATGMGHSCTCCCLSYFVPFFGLFAMVVGRRRVQKKYSIPEPFINTVLTSWCCGCCALNQDLHELKTRESAEISFSTFIADVPAGLTGFGEDWEKTKAAWDKDSDTLFKD
eukprot:NODE_1735_length_753_cov_152.397764_g1686_i0.p1 GENE.NODE_1735_length_753_cov_152.397764_g1686_i0~~NODE_1735_length_753_cov_152.397764_g1686_i0.p1  ORF type:complete len:144 (+),score=31.06 NODE_1735_length_753_cov_152.397764_g1686_i0:266-697(+)